MIYGSVCSGIEAPTVAWHPLGWRPAFFSDIEDFPRKLLAHHYPDVPCHGDFTTISGDDYGPIDLLVGGTPCQAFSVAGLRKGFDDDRGNLTLEFVRLAQRKEPKWILWENVPGVLSIDGGKAITCFLDSLEELGYICDIDILDAQFFGVPQRRRRVFVCGQHRDDLLSKTTISSVLTIAQCLVEILRGICHGQLHQYEKEPLKLVHPSLSRDGVLRRMRLFGITEERSSFERPLNILVEAFQKYQRDVKNWDLSDGASDQERIADDLLTDFETDNRYIPTEQSLRELLEGAYEVMKLFITSTATNSITNQKISMCFKAALTIGRLILRLRRSSPPSWQAGQSFLTAFQEFINYARQANKDLFGQLFGVYSWSDLIREAEPIDKAIGYLGDWRPAAAVLFERQSLCGDITPSREEREGAAICFEPRSQDGVPRLSGDVSPTLNTAQGGQRQPCVMTYDRQSTGEYGTDPVASTVAARDYKGPTDLVSYDCKVRRLTPKECERLQGFPDDYTLVPFRVKPAADSHRYKALGNSMAVPVMRWIGERIDKIEFLLKT